MTPARVTRAMYPNRTSVRVKAGSSRYSSCVMCARAFLGLRRHRQPAEPDREHEDEDDPGDELGHRGQRDSRDGDRLVGEPPVAQPREHTAEDRHRHADQERDEGELERVLERGLQQIPGRHLLRQRGTEIALDEASRPVHVLGEGGSVRSELLVERVDRLLRRERAEDGAADVAGEDRGDPEHDHAQEEERDAAPGRGA